MSDYKPDLFIDPDQATRAGYAGDAAPSSPPPLRAEGTLARLRDRVARIERGRAPTGGRAPVLGTGFTEIDDTLDARSGGEAGLSGGAIHGLAGPGAQALLLRLLRAVMIRDARPILWAVPWTAPETLYGPGLAQAGLATDQLIITRARKPAELLWTMEEALRSGALSTVVGEPEGRLTLTASRRLQLAAEAGGGFGFLLGAEDDGVAPSALHSRWRAAPLPSGIDADGTVSRRLGITLLRHRAGATGHWEVGV